MNKRFEVLDSFRGIAALSVVIFHMHYIGSITEYGYFRGSYLFVEFFFVLSGFVLAHGYAFKKNMKFKNFLISRTFRLMPLHVFMLIVFILFEFGKLLAYKYGFSFNHEPFTNSTAVKDIIPNLLLLQTWLPFSTSLSWNYPSWSISVEYYMYIIFFVTLFTNNMKYIIWFLISFISFLFLINNSDLLHDVLRGLSSFFAGSLVYIIYLKTNQKVENVKRYIYVLLEFLLVFLIIYVISMDKFEYKSIIATVLFMISVYLFSFEKGFISILLRKKFPQLLGKLSYSIYMTHAAILFISLSTIMIFEKILKTKLTIMVGDVRNIDIGNAIFNNMAILFIVIIVILISLLTYKFIEINGQKIGKKFISK